MKDNELNRRQEPDVGAPVSYTPEQRNLIQKGLRIWAKVAVRSYLRKHGMAPDRSEAAEDGGEGEERCAV